MEILGKEIVFFPDRTKRPAEALVMAWKKAIY